MIAGHFFDLESGLVLILFGLDFLGSWFRDYKLGMIVLLLLFSLQVFRLDVELAR